MRRRCSRVGASRARVGAATLIGAMIVALVVLHHTGSDRAHLAPQPGPVAGAELVRPASGHSAAFPMTHVGAVAVVAASALNSASTLLAALPVPSGSTSSEGMIGACLAVMLGTMVALYARPRRGRQDASDPLRVTPPTSRAVCRGSPSQLLAELCVLRI